MNDAPSSDLSLTVKLPEGVQDKPGPHDEKGFEEPVKWLLGDQIIADLKLLVLSAVYGSKLDSRDWMTPDLIRFRVPKQNTPRQSQPTEVTPKMVETAEPAHDEPEKEREQALKNILRVIELPHVPEPCGIDPKTEFWFDYLADTGDGQRATYGVAYGCMSHLSINSTEIGAEVRQARSEDCEAIIKGGGIFLPRGKFQFIGGDTCYNVAEYTMLVERFQSPFCWAYKDLVEGGYFTEKEAKSTRPLFGIPGNHDYYDALDGFNRQFRQPITEKLGRESDRSEPLHIPGFRRFQQASYVALHLPFDWWLWGLDTESDELDFRQKEFFKNLRTPNKLIVATPAPTTHLGRRPRFNDKLTEIFKSIELELAFLSDKEKRKMKDLPKEMWEIPKGRCRLDLSGDIHHYVRYWGTPAQASSPWGEDYVASNPKAPHAENYASVMAGGGGASFHPSDTDIGEIRGQVLYPERTESRAAIFRKLFDPLAILKAGKVWLLGIIIASFVCFAVTVPQSGKEAFNNFFLWEWAGVAQPMPIRPTANSVQEQVRLQREAQATAAPLHERFFREPWDPQKLLRDSPRMQSQCGPCFWGMCREQYPLYFWGVCETPWALDYYLGLGLAFLSPILILGWAMQSKQILTDGPPKPDKSAMTDAPLNRDKEKEAQSHEPKKKSTPSQYFVRATIKIVTRVFFALLMLVLGIILIHPLLAYITPFGHSLLLFLTLVMTAGTVAIALQYHDWRFKLFSQKKVPIIKFGLHNDPETYLWLAAVVMAGVGFFFFGVNNLASYLASDVLLWLFVLLIVPGLILLAVSSGRELNGGDKSLPGFLLSPMGLLFVLIGVWHAALQLLVPIFLIHSMNVLTLIYVVIVLALFIRLGRIQARYKRRKRKLNNRATLLTLWFIFGALLLLWPLMLKAIERWVITPGRLPFLGKLVNIKFFNLYAEGFNKDYVSIGIMLVVAALIGAVMSCIWVGWYLAVMLACNAHNAEAGGAARLENYNEFIRIRLTNDELTAYVIGFNDAKEDGTDLDFRLIDTFTIRPGKPNAAANAGGS